MPRRKPTARPSPAPRERTRGEDGLEWLYGVHPVLAALANPARRPRRLLVTADSRHHLAANPAAATAAETLERRQLDQLLPPGAVHQGIALLTAPLPHADLLTVAALQPGQRNVVVVLDQVTDPHNVGAVLRSAAAFGARAVVTTERRAPGVSGALAKAASGGLELVPLVQVTNLARALNQLAELGYWRLGLAASAAGTLAEAHKGLDSIALVLGAEGKGLRRLTAASCDSLARLPTRPVIDSLNVSNAAAIALYELARRGQGPV